MKGFMVIAGMALTLSAGQDNKQGGEAEVMVYFKPNSIPVVVEHRAKTQVTWMFHQIGVRVNWKTGAPSAMMPGQQKWPVSVEVTYGLGPQEHPGAYAFSTPYSEQGSITIMYDRIAAATAGKSQTADALLAHVLAHELGHLLEGIARHSEKGLMKAHWTPDDIDSMTRRPMAFGTEDISFIRAGMASRMQRASR